MSRLSIWSKSNLILSGLILIVAFLAPILLEKFSYSAKRLEVESVVKNIAENQSEHYALNNQYISLKRSEQQLLTKKFNKIGKDDLNYYNYSVSTEINSFKILAEPKAKFLKTRELFPQVYTYKHVLKGSSNGSWSQY